MKCSDIAGLLSQYLDGELDELRRRGVQRHMEKCAGCGRELATLSNAVRVMRAVAEMEPPRDYRHAVLPAAGPPAPFPDAGAGKKK